MSDKNLRNFKVEIEKTENGTLIRVTDVNQTNFENAYRLATNLLNRASKLDSELLQIEVVEKARSRTAMYWIPKGDTKRISDFVTQRSHRIALSLLEVYPKGKLQSEIVKETGIYQATAPTQLSGKIHSVASFFDKRGKRYFLTETGLEWVLREVIPFVSSSSSDT